MYELEINSSNQILNIYNEEQLLYDSIEKKLSVLPILLMILGIIGNSLALYVLTRKKLRVQSTMLYFASLTIIDSIALCQWNFSFFFKHRLNPLVNSIEEQSLFLCKYVSFIEYFLLQTSAWVLAIITIDRYLFVTNVKWKQNFSRNIKFNLTFIVLIVFLNALFNLPVVFMNGRITNSNSIENNIQLPRIECYSTKFMLVWQKISFISECLLPLLIMFIFNFLLIHRTYKSSTKFHDSHNANFAFKRSLSMNSYFETNLGTLFKGSSNSFYEIKNPQKIGESSKFLNKINEQNNLIEIAKRSNSKLNLVNNADKAISTSTTSAILEAQTKQPNQLALGSNNSYLSPYSHIQSFSKPKFYSFSDQKELLENLHKFMKNSSSKESVQDHAQEKKSDEKSTQMVLDELKQEVLNGSLANLDFLRLIRYFDIKDLRYLEPSKDEFCEITAYLSEEQAVKEKPEEIVEPSISNVNTSSLNLNSNLSHKSQYVNSSDKSFTSSRNKRIVLMLSLLTLSFAISTLPSTVFYTFYRVSLNDKPYIRLISISLTLLKHLSHIFNFIIYFTFSSLIRQQFKEIVGKIKFKCKTFMSEWIPKFFLVNCCFCVNFDELDLHSQLSKTKSQRNLDNQINSSLNFRKSFSTEHSSSAINYLKRKFTIRDSIQSTEEIQMNGFIHGSRSNFYRKSSTNSANNNAAYDSIFINIPKINLKSAKKSKLFWF